MVAHKEGNPRYVGESQVDKGILCSFECHTTGVSGPISSFVRTSTKCSFGEALFTESATPRLSIGFANDSVRVLEPNFFLKRSSKTPTLNLLVSHEDTDNGMKSVVSFLNERGPFQQVAYDILDSLKYIQVNVIDEIRRLMIIINGFDLLTTTTVGVELVITHISEESKLRSFAHNYVHIPILHCTFNEDQKTLQYVFQVENLYTESAGKDHFVPGHRTIPLSESVDIIICAVEMFLPTLVGIVVLILTTNHNLICMFIYMLIRQLTIIIIISTLINNKYF